LEENVSLMYRNMADSAEMPLIKSILLSISQDSSKHASLLSGIADSISGSKKNYGNCEKNLGEVWGMVKTYLTETKNAGQGQPSFTYLFPKLLSLESTLGEEYYVFVQMKTLQLMTKEINQFYAVNLESIKKVIESIIKDEEHHRELLATLKELSEVKRKEYDYAPIVKYQSPDKWINSTPNSP
jgi:rubrerythrin